MRHSELIQPSRVRRCNAAYSAPGWMRSASRERRCMDCPSPHPCIGSSSRSLRMSMSAVPRMMSLCALVMAGLPIALSYRELTPGAPGKSRPTGSGEGECGRHDAQLARQVLVDEVGRFLDVCAPHVADRDIAREL